MSNLDVIIIGAGTAGLTARREAAKVTDKYIVIEGGPMGTTCARVGCMPSKVLIQVANDFHQYKKLQNINVVEKSELKIDRVEVMKHVRSLRDRFVKGVTSSTSSWSDKLVRGYAKFINENTVEVNGEQYKANKIIIATGSRPSVPQAWEKFKDYILDTNDFFEQEKLDDNVLVVGLGVIGLELGQALSRLGVNVIAASSNKSIAGLSDPEIQDYTYEKLENEFKIYLERAELIEITDDNKIKVKLGDKYISVDKVLLSMGRKPNIDKLDIEKTGVSLNDKGLPKVDFNTMCIEGAEHLFLPGDVNTDRPILHEAADEGKISGFNAVNEEKCFKRRVPLGITFSDPNIAKVGKSYSELKSENTNFITGKVTFEGQGRSIVKLKEQGLLHVYMQEETGLILGAELQAPAGEHLAHLLAWAISMKLTVFEALKMPFYHPVIEEGLRTALRDGAKQVKGSEDYNELFRCDDSPIR